MEHSVGVGLGAICILTGKEDGGAIASVVTLQLRYTLWLSSRGEVVDSFATPKPRIVVDRDTPIFIWRPTLEAVWSPDGSRVAAWTEDFAIEVDHAPRETPALNSALTLITMNVDRAPLAMEERAYLIDMLRTMRDRRGGSEDTSVEEATPTHKPVIVGLLVGEDGRVWMRGQTASIKVDDHRFESGLVDGWGEHSIFYVLSPDGPSVRALRPSFPIIPWFARGDTVWASYESELGAPKVGRFTVTW